MTTPNALSSANRQKLQDRLSQAIFAEDVPLVRRLLAQGADPASPGGSLMRTPLMTAASCHNLELIELLLPFNDIDAASSGGETAIGIFIDRLCFCDMFGSVPPDWRHGLRRLLSSTNASSGSSTELSPLISSSSFWFSKCIRFDDLLDELFPLSGLDEDAVQDAILAALSSNGSLGGLRAIELLRRVKNKAVVLSWRGNEQETLVHVAARHGKDDFLAEISSLADFEARDSRGRTPLMAACSKSLYLALPCIKLLLERGCDPRLLDDDGCDALMMLIENISEGFGTETFADDTISLLIHKSNLMARDFLGESALDKARDRKCFPLVQRLEQAAAFPSPQPTTAPYWPQPTRQKLQDLLFHAIERGDASLVERRLAQGADPRRERVAVVMVRGQQLVFRHTALMAAVTNPTSPEIIAILAPLSDLLAVNATGETSLSIFLARQLISTSIHMSSMRALFSSDAAKISNNQGRFPLAIVRADANMWPEVISLLGPASDWMALDADGNNILASQRQHEFAPDYDGDTALWIAHPDQAWLASTRNKNGETLAHIAASGCAVALLKSIADYSDFAAATPAGVTPLMAGCLRGLCLEDICDTLAPWSDCGATDANGCDALMLALEAVEADGESQGFCKGIEMLVRRANVDAKDFFGESALDKALARGLAQAALIIRAHQEIFAERSELEATSNASATTSSSKGSSRI